MQDFTHGAADYRTRGGWPQVPPALAAARRRAVKSEKRRVKSFGRAASAARFFHFANVWQNRPKFAKHWQNR
jgi:hypothetical protein